MREWLFITEEQYSTCIWIKLERHNWTACTSDMGVDADQHQTEYQRNVVSHNISEKTQRKQKKVANRYSEKANSKCLLSYQVNDNQYTLLK